MNIQGHREVLSKLSPQELNKFNADFGGGQKTIEEQPVNLPVSLNTNVLFVSCLD